MCVLDVCITGIPAVQCGGASPMTEAMLSGFVTSSHKEYVLNTNCSVAEKHVAKRSNLKV